MMVFKRKQIVVLSLVLMFVVAGYLQHSYNKNGVSQRDPDYMPIADLDDESTSLGEALYVGDPLIPEDDAENNLESNKVLQASKEASDFFAQAKMDKDMSRARDKETLGEISNDMNVSEEQRNMAYEKMMSLIDNSDKEMRIETLIKNRGFSDVVVLFGEDGNVDIVVKAPSISSVDVAQISEIVSRQAGVDIPDIHVTHKF